MNLKDKIIIWVIRKNIIIQNKKIFYIIWLSGILVWVIGWVLKYYFGLPRTISEIIFWSTLMYLNLSTLFSLDYFIKKTRTKYLKQLVGDNEKVKVICAYKDKDLKLNAEYEINHFIHHPSGKFDIDLSHIDVGDKKIFLNISKTVFKLVSPIENRKLKLKKLDSIKSH